MDTKRWIQKVPCDKNVPSVLLLLDLSAAFDTVDHEKLLNILYADIGITGVTLNWFRSFLTNCTQKVRIRDSFSEIVVLLFGVAQGTILGPRLFGPALVSYEIASVSLSVRQ